MAFLQIISLVWILLNIRSIGCVLANFSCESYRENGEYGKNTHISCRNNQAIESVTVKFCPYNNCCCPGDPEINTREGKNTSKDGRISLKLDNFAILTFNNVQISDKKCYHFFLASSNGHKYWDINLPVVAPYTEPQLIRKKDTVECTATGGYPNKHLYWFDTQGTNLTHNATFMSTQNVGGSFFLNSSFHLDSLTNETTYCCTFNNTTNCHSFQNCACMILGKVTSSKSVSENTTSYSTPISVIVILVSAVAVAVAAYFLRKKKRNVLQVFVSLRREPMPEEDF